MSTETEFIALKARVAELEDRIRFLYKHLHVEFEENPLAANVKVMALVKQGKLIEAIKMYREIYNVDLAEAKEAVDDLQVKLGMK
jgi:ribosomal protein L7/L12